MIVILQYLRHELSVPMTVLVYYEVGTQWDNIRTSRKYAGFLGLSTAYSVYACDHVSRFDSEGFLLPLSLSLPLLSEGFPLAVPLRPAGLVDHNEKTCTFLH